MEHFCSLKWCALRCMIYYTEMHTVRHDSCTCNKSSIPIVIDDLFSDIFTTVVIWQIQKCGNAKLNKIFQSKYIILLDGIFTENNFRGKTLDIK